MDVNQPVTLPPGFSFFAQQVLNPWEQTLYNLCEEYFGLNQLKSNRHPVLSQVRLSDVISHKLPIIKDIQVPATVVEHVHVPPFLMDLHVNALSFDILITNGQGYPRAIFEADGKYHDKPSGLHKHKSAKARRKIVRDWARQVTRDKYKDAIARKVGIPLFRVKVEGLLTHLDVVHAEAMTHDFQRDLQYPLATGGYIDYSEYNFPDQKRLIEAADLEVRLIRAGWRFPKNWQFVTQYELR